jgi:hypothetical protein
LSLFIPQVQMRAGWYYEKDLPDPFWLKQGGISAGVEGMEAFFKRESALVRGDFSFGGVVLPF